MDQTTVLSQVIAAAYIAFGLFGLLAVSIPSNRHAMFLGASPTWLGPTRVVLAYLTLIVFVTCGIAVWFWPLAVKPLALAALVLVFLGKVPIIALGHWQSCKSCAFVGPVLVLITTVVLLASRS